MRRSIDKIAEAEVRVIALPSGNYNVVVGAEQTFPHAVSTWGSRNDAKVAQRRLQLFLMRVLLDDRRDHEPAKLK